MDANDPKDGEIAHPTVSRASIEGWPLRWKVAATLILPIVLAATFGAVRIYNELSAASRLGIASDNAVIVVPAVELVDRLDQLAYAGATGAPIEEPLAQFDESAAALTSMITSADFDSSVATELTTASSTAKELRDEISSGPVPQPEIAEQGQAVATGVISAIAKTTATADDSAVRPLADRLVTALAAQRALTTQRVLVATPRFVDSVGLRTEVADAAGAEAAAIDRLAQLTTGDDVAALREASDVRRDAYTQPLSESVSAPGFTDAMQASVDQYRAMTQQLASDLDRTLHARANALRSDALRDTAIILGAVLIALVFALAVGRSLIRSISRLRRGALQVAQVELPEEIERLSKGGGMPEVTALPVRTKEEIGQLARAIDDIHLQAVRLAGEHGVRLQIGDMFETLSRRSRSLVEQQLALIETLELDEDDPVRLEHLFRLDHLATRMRRNGDNLLVLADTVERHRISAPVPLGDVLRAAMSEVEDYRRVQVGHVVDVSILSSAAGDVGHLIAELLDNALRYSPPDSPVVVTVGRAVDAGLLVEIADRGLGMPADDLNAANERLALGGEVTSETAKRMGLFVVGRLARRHDATTRLRATTGSLSDQPGVTASVHLPGTLVAAPDGIVDAPGDRHADSFAAAPQRSTGDRQAAGAEPGAGALDRLDAGSPPTAGTGEARAASNSNRGTLPKRSPGASGVNGLAAPAAPVPATEGQPRSNPLSFFTAAPTPSQATPATPDVPTPPEPALAAEPAPADVESESSPIFERMASEWLMDPTSRESRDQAWASAADAAWAAAAKAVEQEPKRHTESGLPIRERGARLVPDDLRPEPAARAGVGHDPAAIRDMLSRQLAGVRRGRAETDAADRRLEGDR
ncbi:HAMP domain-containing histidine kinase [Mycobacterium sp. 21AC1]|uniref:sensor histidine kinase n=1 Tax=[Mycobacterium] appelbergii TaxID=2939269 RepID=UPI0029392564|nr:HAMP domain-containing sensor histidine kinase [Mycobacterium sp. 21AC1]MDV3128555.1 HAMP domain-containing histidine kinase [Mycobacterium sp. 21AC1]